LRTVTAEYTIDVPDLSHRTLVFHGIPDHRCGLDSLPVSRPPGITFTADECGAFIFTIPTNCHI
jgi:hypothetical protein